MMLGNSSQRPQPHETIDLTGDMDDNLQQQHRQQPRNGYHPIMNGAQPQQQQQWPFHPQAHTSITPNMINLPLPSMAATSSSSQVPYHTTRALPPRPTQLPIPPLLPQQQQQQQQRQQQRLPHPVIDLTEAPSPAPAPAPSLPDTQPVCIGQLKVTALILYPNNYLTHPTQLHTIPPEARNNPHAQEELAPVKLVYLDPKKAHSRPSQETINVLQPQPDRAAPPNSFAVVEQKAANVLGPMLGRGLVRVDARIWRSVAPRPPMLPLLLLVFTLPPNVPTLANLLANAGLYLDHPIIPYDPARHSGAPYANPHNPPAGGHRAFIAQPYMQGKTMEVQRSQVDEVFKSLRQDGDLRETQPGPEIGTKLYPHQKQALTFLLEREGEIPGGFSILKEMEGKRKRWRCLVTNKEFDRQPPQCKGAILADDMGLGKTISVVSLMAATMDAARAYGGTSAPRTLARPSFPKALEPPLTAAHFAGSVWGMPAALPPPPPPPPQPAAFTVPMSKKATKAEKAEKSEEKRARSEYARQQRIRCRSRATLIVCPLSTVVNWEDQLREHWAGPVTIVGGGGVPVQASTAHQADEEIPTGIPGVKVKSKARMERAPLTAYVYHGNARRPDPDFLANFDVVITTYSTLATEYSKQARTAAAGEEDADDGFGDDEEGSSDGIEEVDGMGMGVSTGVKRKRGTGSGSGTPSAEVPSPLQQVDWFRVVLDEAHSIKEPSTVACRAACDLIANRRICLTGTPVQNKLDDVYALIKFIRLQPFDDKAVWTEYIGGPAKFGQPLGVARLQTIMKSITLRRTKETKAGDGRKILALPTKREELRFLKFDPEERKIYDGVFDASKADFESMTKKGEVMKNYVGILQRILRLRQICDHWQLVQEKGQADDSELEPEELINAIQRDGINLARATAVFNLLREAATSQCIECGYELAVAPASVDDIDGEVGGGPGRKTKKARPTAATAFVPRPVLTRCQHLFCMRCFQASICPGWPKVAPDVRRACSACRATLTPATDVVEVAPDGSLPDPTATSSKPKTTAAKRKEKAARALLAPGAGDDVQMSTKIRALVADLMPFSRANPFSRNYDPESLEIETTDDKGNISGDGVVKTVVFSQWTSMLDKIEDALHAASIRFDRLDGTMRRDERSKAMDALKNDPACEVLLVSLRAGGVGLNLTAAQRVYLMDPYWNPAVENQAVDRIHRLGQTKPVMTIKLVIEDTVEARMLEVQKRKTALANMTLGATPLTKTQMMERRMEELQVLFRA